MSCHIRVVSRVYGDASWEERKKDVERMQKQIRQFYNEKGSIKDKIEKYERYEKPSQKRRHRAKIERNRALSRKKEQQQ